MTSAVVAPANDVVQPQAEALNFSLFGVHVDQNVRERLAEAYRPVRRASGGRGGWRRMKGGRPTEPDLVLRQDHAHK